MFRHLLPVSLFMSWSLLAGAATKSAPAPVATLPSPAPSVAPIDAPEANPLSAYAASVTVDECLDGNCEILVDTEAPQAPSHDQGLLEMWRDPGAIPGKPVNPMLNDGAAVRPERCAVCVYDNDETAITRPMCNEFMKGGAWLGDHPTMSRTDFYSREFAPVIANWRRAGCRKPWVIHIGHGQAPRVLYESMRSLVANLGTVTRIDISDTGCKSHAADQNAARVYGAEPEAAVLANLTGSAYIWGNQSESWNVRGTPAASLDSLMQSQTVAYFILTAPNRSWTIQGPRYAGCHYNREADSMGRICLDTQRNDRVGCLPDPMRNQVAFEKCVPRNDAISARLPADMRFQWVRD